jgi:hypothetical protein
MYQAAMLFPYTGYDLLSIDVFRGTPSVQPEPEGEEEDLGEDLDMNQSTHPVRSTIGENLLDEQEIRYASETYFGRSGNIENRRRDELTEDLQEHGSSEVEPGHTVDAPLRWENFD